MIVICAGMYRSGSTWQYQVAGELLDQNGGCTRLGYLGCHQFPELNTTSTTGPVLLKAHEGHPICTEWLATGQARCLYSYRDLRDVACSFAYKLGISLGELVQRNMLQLCQLNHEFWSRQPNSYSQRYESWMENPAPSVVAIANLLEVPVTPDDVDRIVARYSLPENRRRTEQFAERLQHNGIDLTRPENVTLSDAETQLHWNHIRTGAVGSWRNGATPGELELLAAECGPWLIRNEYESDPLWGAIGHRGSSAHELVEAMKRIAELERILADTQEMSRRFEAALVEANQIARQYETAFRESQHHCHAFTQAQRIAAEQARVLAGQVTQLEASLHAEHEQTHELRVRLHSQTRTLESGLACWPYRMIRRARSHWNYLPARLGLGLGR